MSEASVELIVLSTMSALENYRDCCITAELPASTRFHSLRRALSTSIVTTGISVSDVAQVLGNKNVNSTKPHIF